MDIQAFINAMNEAGRQTRAQYQLTIGKAIEALSAIPPQTPIQYPDGKAPADAMSYRGYYSDLSFKDQDAATVGDVLAELQCVKGETLEGYKGGNYRMGDDTPIWRSEYGSASGVGWMEISEFDGRAVISTKQVD